MIHFHRRFAPIALVIMIGTASSYAAGLPELATKNNLIKTAGCRGEAPFLKNYTVTFGGTTYGPDGVISVTPNSNSICFVALKVPPKARHFKAVAGYYSGASCTGKGTGMFLEIKENGVLIWPKTGGKFKVDGSVFDIDVPLQNATEIDILGDSNGDCWCDDLVFGNANFSE